MDGNPEEYLCCPAHLVLVDPENKIDLPQVVHIKKDRTTVGRDRYVDM